MGLAARQADKIRRYNLEIREAWHTAKQVTRKHVTLRGIAGSALRGRDDQQRLFRGLDFIFRTVGQEQCASCDTKRTQACEVL